MASKKTISVEEQSEIASKVVGMILGRVHSDETTDNTGYTITKKKLAEHAAGVVKDIEHGALQPVKLRGGEWF